MKARVTQAPVSGSVVSHHAPRSGCSRPRSSRLLKTPCGPGFSSSKTRWRGKDGTRNRHIDLILSSGPSSSPGRSSAPTFLTLSSGEAAYRRARPRIRRGMFLPSFDTALTRLLRMRRLGCLRARSRNRLFQYPPQGVCPSPIPPRERSPSCCDPPEGRCSANAASSPRWRGTCPPRPRPWGGRRPHTSRVRAGT